MHKPPRPDPTGLQCLGSHTSAEIFPFMDPLEGAVCIELSVLLPTRKDGPRGAPRSTRAGAGAPSLRPCFPLSAVAPAPSALRSRRPRSPRPPRHPRSPSGCGSPGSRLRAKWLPGRAGAEAVQFAPPRHAPGTAGRARALRGGRGSAPDGDRGHRPGQRRGRHTENALPAAGAAVRTELGGAGLRLLRDEKLPRLKTAGTAARVEPREEGSACQAVAGVPWHTAPVCAGSFFASSGPGKRVSRVGKRVPAQCWALHGVRATRWGLAGNTVWVGGDSSAESPISVMDSHQSNPQPHILADTSGPL